MQPVFIVGHVPEGTPIPSGCELAASVPPGGYFVMHERHRDTSRWVTVPRVRQWAVYGRSWALIGHFITAERAAEVVREHRQFARNAKA